jgi:hypothetical protein
MRKMKTSLDEYLMENVSLRYLWFVLHFLMEGDEVVSCKLLMFLGYGGCGGDPSTADFEEE